MGKYDGLTQDQLVSLLEKRDREKRLGLVWERDEIEADKAVDANFVSMVLDGDLSGKAAPWRNLVIEGDNYDALRWLRMTHAKRVKCIYVDPPYNTGSKDWVYNDSYFDKEDRYRFSTWLEFLFRRFTLARELLSEDGVILVSINDENRALMELMLEQALPGMRLGSFVWRSRQGSNADQGAFLSVDHEHILAFGNPTFKFTGTEKSFSMYRFWDEVRQDFYRLSDLSFGFNYKERQNLFFPLIDPRTEVVYPANPNRVWVYPLKERLKPGQKLASRAMDDWLEDGRIQFPQDQKIVTWNSMEDLLVSIDNGDVPISGRTPKIWKEMPNLNFWIGKKVGFGTPSFKRYMSELRNPTQPVSSWIFPRSDVSELNGTTNALSTGTNDEGTKALKTIFVDKVFNYPKPPSLIRELVRQSSSPGDLVVDFFAGSATTAQAVMELNAEDGGDRRFIMVSSTEANSEEPDKNLCRDVTAERIRRLNGSEDAKFANLGAEFAYLKARKIKFEDLDLDLTPPEAWSSLEALHDLPLTVFEPDAAWNQHATDGQTLIYADSVTPALIAHIGQLIEKRTNLFVYCWAPGQLNTHFKGKDVEIRPVRASLVKRFQQ